MCLPLACGGDKLIIFAGIAAIGPYISIKGKSELLSLEKMLISSRRGFKRPPEFLKSLYSGIRT